MRVARDHVVGIEIQLWDVHGNLLDQSDGASLYLHGGYDGVFAAVESALDGKLVGEQVEITLEPVDAFGEYDENLVQLEPRDRFPQELEVGMQLEGLPDDAPEDEEARIYTVTDIADEVVVVDGNHPYAGIAVRFVCKVASIRAATADEIEQGVPDDPSGGLLRVAH